MVWKPTSPSPYISFRNCFLPEESICGMPKIDKRCAAQASLKRSWVCTHDVLNITIKNLPEKFRLQCHFFFSNGPGESSL
jgi:hypothetical protein